MSPFSDVHTGPTSLVTELLGGPLQLEGEPTDSPRAYRLILAFGALLILVFGTFYHQIGTDVVDPLSVRGGLAALSLAIVAGSYVSEGARRDLGRLFRGWMYLLIPWYGGLLIANQYAWSYGMGAVFLHAATGLAFGVGLRRSRPLGWYLGLSTIAWLGGGFAVAAPQTPLLLLTLSLISIAVLVYIVTGWRIQSERQLRTSRYQYRQLYREHELIFEAARESIILADRTRQEGQDRFEVRRINASHEKRLGRTSEELRGETARQMLGPEAGAKVEDQLRRCIEEGKPIDYTLDVPTSSGHRYFHSKLTPIETAGGEISAVLVIARDITEQKEREHALREQQRILDQIRQNATDVIWVSTPEGKIEFVSRAFEEIWGRPSSDLVEAPRATVLEGIHPDDRDRVRKALEDRRDQPEDYEEVYRVVQPDGTVQWVRDRASGVYDEDGELIRVVGVASDITSQKRWDEQLRLLDRLIQHDLRGDVTTAQGWAEMLENGADPQKASSRIRGATAHMMEILDGTDALQRALRSGQRMEHRAVELRPVVDRAVQTTERRFPKARITTEYLSSSPIFVQANELLGSVFENLITNAVRHNDQEVPEVEVRVDNRDDRVRVEVADNGPGIPPAQGRKIFEKDRRGLDSPGMGLGLYLVQTLVRLYEGTVEVTDNEPRGARFIVGLEAVDRKTG